MRHKLSLLVLLGMTTVLQAHDTAITEQSVTKAKKAQWTVMVYMSADNDLFSFAGRNIKQMEAIGSNENLNIIIQLDTNRYGKGKITHRYKINHNSRELLFNPNIAMDSGDPDTLVDFCTWGIEEFPAEHYAVILWNHGSGALEPAIGRAINPSHLFTYNHDRDIIELDRSINFMNFLGAHEEPVDIEDPVIKPIERPRPQTRGICFDESTGNYITNQGLDYAFGEINKALGGKNIDIIGLDACLMAMTEIAAMASRHADFMVASQEVELGTGWNYARVLLAAARNKIEPQEFANHIVQSFEQSYGRITNDYTLSAIKLANFNELEKNISAVAECLITAIDHQVNKSVREVITYCKSPRHCTCFDEPTYIDLYDFYCNLEKRMHRMQMDSRATLNNIRAQLKTLLAQGKNIIANTVTAVVSGSNLSRAHGLSIYLPTRLHPSYRLNEYAVQMNWLRMITAYILSR
jgi:hypothetical protein